MKCCQRSTLRGYCSREATARMHLPKSKSSHPWQLLCPFCVEAMRRLHPGARILPLRRN